MVVIHQSRCWATVIMSSEDDDVVLQKHGGKLSTSLARTAAKGTHDDNGSRRYSKDSQSSRLSQIVSSTGQSRHVQPPRKSAAASPPDDDSDDDAHTLKKYQHNLLTHAKVLNP